jgi:hypothetical protein
VFSRTSKMEVPLAGVCEAERAPLLGIIKRGVASPLGVYPPWG